MPHIKALEIDNFKSYLDHHVIPFEYKFTAAIGPNGAGKSNLMDAFSFALGVHSKDLRGGSLSDLIYKMEGKPRPKFASVTIIFETEDEGNDLMDSEVAFSRRVNLKGSSTYSINDSVVPAKEYIDALDKLGILVKAKNFLVFQGDVTSIANKTPTDLTKYFERVSGSERFKEEYDTLKVEKAAAERSLKDIVQQRKAISQEKKIIEKQKKEAEDFHRKTEQHAHQRQQLTLWKLHHAMHRCQEAEQTREASERDRAALQQEIDVHTEKLASLSASLGAKKKTLLRRSKAVHARERDRNAKRLKLSEAKKKVAATKKGLEADQRFQSQLEARVAEQETKLESLKEHVAAMEAEREALDLEIVNDAQNQGNNKLNLTPPQLAEYKTLKAEANRKSASLMQKSSTLSERAARLRTKKEEVAREIADLEAQKNVEIEEIARHEKSIEVASERLGKDEEFLAKTKSSIAATEAKLRENAAQYETVIGKMAATNEKLSKLMDTRLSSSREEKKQRNLELLQRQFHGVHGRLGDLVKPTQRKYNLAVSTALSKHMDAIVVDHESTAIEMAQFLSSNRAMLRETILPLDVLDPPHVKERLRQLGAGRKLVSDVMTYEQKFAKAVDFGCANVVLCETLTDARRLRFQQGVECKVVTVDGSTISLSNTMSGGKSQAAAAKAGRWDKKESDTLKKQLRKLSAQRMEIEKAGYSAGDDTEESSRGSRSASRRRNRHLGTAGSAGSLSRELDRLRAQRTNLVSKIDRLRDFISEHQQKLVDGRKRVKTLEAAISEKAPEQRTIQEQIEEVETSAAQLDEKVAAIGRAVFEDFSERLGIADIHDFHERVAARQNAQGHRRQSILENLSKSSNSIKYDEAKLANSQKALRRISDSVQRYQRKFRNLEVTVQSAQDALELSESRLQEEQEAEAIAKGEMKEAQDAIKAERAARDALTKQHESLAERTTVAAEKVQLLQTQMHEILQRAQVENVVVPMLDDDDDESEAESSSAGPSQDEAGHLQAKARAKQQKNLQQIDFEELEDQDIIEDHDDYDAYLAQAEAAVKALAAELDEMQPNLRAAELFKDVLARIKANDEDYNDSKEKFARVNESFEKVRTNRRKAFMKAFNHVSEAINDVYVALTKDEAHPHGGNASLSLIGNAMDPFLGGVKYIASAPSKRFRQIGSLSGGEQTMAALALLFSVHSFKPSPFYIMDEIDAALDNANVKKVAEFIKSRSKNFQCLVISLKDLFYSEAEALVGIYRDRGQDCSRSLTLDLSPYRQRA